MKIMKEKVNRPKFSFHRYVVDESQKTSPDCFSLRRDPDEVGVLNLELLAELAQNFPNGLPPANFDGFGIPEKKVDK